MVGRRQAVRRGSLDPVFEGSNPSAPANQRGRAACRSMGDPFMATGFGELKVFSGSAHPELTQEIAAFLGVTVGPGAAAPVSGFGSLVPDRREHPRDRRLHRAADQQSGRSAPDGADDHDRCVPPLVGVAHHGGAAVLRLRAAGSQGQAARADFGQAGGQRAQRGRHQPRADDGSAQGADSGVL